MPIFFSVVKFIKVLRKISRLAFLMLPYYFNAYCKYNDICFRDSSLVLTQNFPKKQHYLPNDAHVYVCISEGRGGMGGKKLVFGKFCVRTKLMIPLLKCIVEMTQNKYTLGKTQMTNPSLVIKITKIFTAQKTKCNAKYRTLFCLPKVLYRSSHRRCVIFCAQWVKALHSESDESWFKPRQVLGQTLGPNLVTRLPATSGSKSVFKRRN